MSRPRSKRKPCSTCFDPAWKYRSCEKQRPVDQIWSCGVFFQDALETTEEQHTDRYQAVVERFLAERPLDLLARHFPDCIALINGPVLLTNKDALQTNPKAPVSMRVFECGKLSVAIVLMNLYDSIQHRGRDMNRRGEWTQLLQKKEFKLIKEIMIPAV